MKKPLKMLRILNYFCFVLQMVEGAKIALLLLRMTMCETKLSNIQKVDSLSMNYIWLRKLLKDVSRNEKLCPL